MRRALLFAVTGVQKTDLTAPPAYTTVLAANATGCALLAEQRKAPKIPTVTRQADIPTEGTALRQRALREAAIALYAACLHKPVAQQALLARNPVILK